MFTKPNTGIIVTNCHKSHAKVALEPVAAQPVAKPMMRDQLFKVNFRINVRWLTRTFHQMVISTPLLYAGATRPRLSFGAVLVLVCEAVCTTWAISVPQIRF